MNAAEITKLLKAWRQGDSAALDRMTPVVYEQLRRLARGYVRKEHPGHTLQTTALVNEAFLRLIDARDVDWQDRTHFLLSARASCDVFWWTRRGSAHHSNAAVRPGELNIQPPSISTSCRPSVRIQALSCARSTTP